MKTERLWRQRVKCEVKLKPQCLKSLSVTKERKKCCLFFLERKKEKKGKVFFALRSQSLSLSSDPFERETL
jgi:hypothetical protein